MNGDEYHAVIIQCRLSCDWKLLHHYKSTDDILQVVRMHTRLLQKYLIIVVSVIVSRIFQSKCILILIVV